MKKLHRIPDIGELGEIPIPLEYRGTRSRTNSRLPDRISDRLRTCAASTARSGPLRTPLNNVHL